MLKFPSRRSDSLLLIARLVHVPGAAAVDLLPTTRLLMSFSLTALVAPHIQIGAGLIELHFGVFVTLAILLVYLDWRPIVFSAALFAVHLARMVSDNAKVAMLAGQLNHGAQIALGVSLVPARSPLAVELKAINGRLAETMRTARQASGNQDLSDAVGKVVETMREIETSSQRIAEIVQSVQQVGQIINEIASSASESLRDQAQKLAEVVSVFRLERVAR